MSDKARSRVRIRCNRCEKSTVHVLYRNSAVVCTCCRQPRMINPRRGK